MKELFPADSSGIDRYYALYDRVMRVLSWQRKLWFTRAGLSGFWAQLNLALAFQAVRHLKEWNAAELMDEFFQDDRLKAVFTTLLADFVTPPSQFPALAIPAINVETPFDKEMPTYGQPTYHYVSGGMENLVKALSGVIRENDGLIHVNARVEKIIANEGRVEGVLLEDGTRISAGLVIASGGVKETMLGLVGEQALPQDFIEKVKDVSLMESVHMVHLGINFDPLPYQRQCPVLLLQYLRYRGCH